MSRENLEKEGITLLGNQKVKYPDNYAPEVLETFLNKHPDNDYFVKFNCPEFTSLCPMTEVINPPYFFAEAKLNISQRSKAVTNTIPTTPEINWPTKTVDANSQ